MREVKGCLSSTLYCARSSRDIWPCTIAAYVSLIAKNMSFSHLVKDFTPRCGPGNVEICLTLTKKKAVLSVPKDSVYITDDLIQKV